MSEKITFEIGTMVSGAFVPTLTFYGDERGEEFPKWRLTNLDGWDMPNHERISVPDPNGGNYVDSHVTKLGKIITLNFSVFFRNDYDGFQALKKAGDDFATEEFRVLRRTTEFPESKVTDTLDGCYKINDISVSKKPGEYAFTISFGSKNYDVVTNTEVTPPPPVDPPVDPTPVPEPVTGVLLGEPSGSDAPTGVGFFWDGVSKTWVANDPTNTANNPAYYAGTTYGQIGVEPWNMGLAWEPRASKWVSYPVSITKLDTTGYALNYGGWVWGGYKGTYVRGYYDPQTNTLNSVNLKTLSSYHDGTVHGEKGTESWNNKLWWSVNGVTPNWQNTNPGPLLPPRDGSDGTYYGEFRARWTGGDNVYWDSGARSWTTENPLLNPMYVAGTEDKQQFLTPYGPIYWNINIGAYQNSDEFFNSRGINPAPMSAGPGQWHGQEAVGEGLFWDSRNYMWTPTNYTLDPYYHTGFYDGWQCMEDFAMYLYWNADIGFYQNYNEWTNFKGFSPP